MVSCIVTLYNKKEYLAECLNSIIDNLQTYKNGLEIIIVEDVSTDGSLDIAKEYAEKYPSLIRLIQNEKNVGAGISRSVGIHAAKGDWISLIDADDYINNDFFKSLEDIAIANDADMVYGNYQSFVDNDYETVNPSLMMHTNMLLTDMEDASLNMPKYQLQFLNVSLTKRSLYESGVEYCPSRFIEDTPTALCLLTKAKRVYVSDYCGYNYRQLSSSLIHSASKVKYTLYLLCNMVWATKFIANTNENLANKLKENFNNEIYSQCCLYRIDAEDFKKENNDMWEEMKAYYNADEKRMNERKQYAITHMSKVIKIK